MSEIFPSSARLRSQASPARSTTASPSRPSSLARVSTTLIAIFDGRPSLAESRFRCSPTTRGASRRAMASSTKTKKRHCARPSSSIASAPSYSHRRARSTSDAASARHSASRAHSEPASSAPPIGLRARIPARSSESSRSSLAAIDPAEKKRLSERLSSVREIVFGVQDGVLTTAGVLCGLSGAVSQHTQVALAALASTAAGALSMAAAAYLGTRAQTELLRAELDIVREAAVHNPYLLTKRLLADP